MSNPVSPTEISPRTLSPIGRGSGSPTSSSPLSPRKTFHKRSNTICYDTSEQPDGFFPQSRKFSTHPNFPRPKPSYQHLTNTGSEPGVDVNKEADRLEYEHLSAPTRVTVVDYTSDGHGSRVDIPGEDFEEWLQSEDGQRPPCDCPPEKDKEKGKSVRWINVDGINFATIKTLAIKYNLHPLALEDALRASANPRSKVDFYASHLYSQIVIQHIKPRDIEDVKEIADMSPESIGRHPGRGLSSWWSRRGGERAASTLPEGVEGVFEPVMQSPVYDTPDFSPPTSAAHRMTIDQLSAKYMIPLRRTVMSIFMTIDGTIITMCMNPFSGLLMPIYKRLEDETGLLRRTGDPSMLMEGILDVIVDIAIEITKAFEQQILKMEAGCLVNTEMESVRHLHVISSQLVRLKRTWTPLLHVLYTLRDQDAQRSAASMMMGNGSTSSIPLANGHAGQFGEHHGHEMMDHNSPASFIQRRPNMLPFNAAASSGYISTTTKVYLSDVIDHLDSVLTSIDQFVGTCEHLTDYIFNMLSFVTNASMERLSLVTVIFLPLTFLAGYYGMNFTDFGSLDNSDTYFWRIAGPLTCSFFLIFCSGYILNFGKTILRKITRKRREEMIVKDLRRKSMIAASRKHRA